jgi:hypothetical protein
VVLLVGGLNTRLMTLLCKKEIIVVKSKAKARSNLAGSCKEGYGSKRAVLPMIILRIRN